MRRPFYVEDIAVIILLVFGLLGIFYIFGKEAGTIKVTTKNKTPDDTQCFKEVADISKNCAYGKFDGHEYVIYSIPNGNGTDSGITHSPDCPCKTNRVEIVQ